VNIAEFKAGNPAYAEIPDEELAVRLHRKFYSSTPWETFARQVGVAPDPTAGQSFAQNVQLGIGKAFTDVGRGVQQLASKVGIGDPAAVQASIEEARRLDQPLMQTAGGTAGNIAGSLALAAPTALVPGVGSYAGATAVGAALGALQPTVGEESRLANIGVGAAGGAGGKLVGDVTLKALTNRLTQVRQTLSSMQAQNAERDAILAAGQQAGYVVPPTQVNPSVINRALEGFSGKIQTGQVASQQNQQVTNQLVRQTLGVGEDIPLTPDLLKGIRRQAGEAYKNLRGAGIIAADKQYADDLAKITAKYTGASKDFPELAKSEIADVVASVNKPQFSSDAAIDAIAILRDQAAAAFAKGDKGLGSAYRQTSQAMEDAIERHLTQSGNQQLLGAFRDARQLIAKTYSVESALNPSGNVSAQKLAAQIRKEKPLTGELRTAGEFASVFPKATQSVEQMGSVPGISPLDVAVAALAGVPGAAMVAGRPMTRAAILSQPFQARLAPNYNVGTVTQLAPVIAGNPRLQRLLPGLGADPALGIKNYGGY
jgi:hypothetical protein